MINLNKLSMVEPNTPAAAAVNVNGRTSAKRWKPPPPPLIVPSGHVAFRLLCHASRVGGIIGKCGSVIKQLQQDTAAKIRVEDSPSHSDDHRVIVIIASNAVDKKLKLKAGKEDFTNSEEVEVSAAQEGVIRVFERIIEVASETEGLPLDADSLVSCRLLVEAAKAGSVIGKGGKVVEKIRKDTGCKIKVLSLEKLPADAMPTDETVEIEGGILAVKKALVAVSYRLQDCQLDRSRTTGSRFQEAAPHETLPDLRADLPLHLKSLPQSMPTSSVNYVSAGQPLSLKAERASTLDFITPQQEMVFRILCSSDRVGGVIGKGGSIIRALQNETSSSISVGASVPDCDERLITVTASEKPESWKSPAQNAVVLVFNRIVEAGMEKGLDPRLKGSAVTARVVVPTNQVGCLLGKGGAIISEMRKITGTGIRIIGGSQVPKCVPESDEVVQITGDLLNVRDALFNVTLRLRNNALRGKIYNDVGARSKSSEINKTRTNGRVRNLPSTGLRSSVDLPSNLNQHTTLTQNMDHLRLSCNSSPKSCASQSAAGINPRNPIDVCRGLTSIKDSMEHDRGSRSVIVANTTVEIVVPENVIGFVYGENGSNLTSLRQISGAKVEVHKSHPETSDRIVVISGTPSETLKAQSLLQAFILK